MIRFSVAALLLLAGGAVARPVHWTLTPMGLGPVRIGMTRSQVERALHVRLKGEAIDDPDVCLEMDTPAYRGLRFMFEYKKLTRISARSPSKLRVRTGIGVGATEQAVRRAYGRKLSIEPHHYEDAPAKYLTDWTVPDKRGIRFETDGNRKVQAIHAGARSITYVEGCE